MSNAMPNQLKLNKNKTLPTQIWFKNFLGEVFGPKENKLSFLAKLCPRYGSSKFDPNASTASGQTLVSQDVWHLEE